MTRGQKPEIPYPVRINRYLFLSGYCSRRKADEYISAGRVKLNGKKAVLGDKVQEGDTVAVDDKLKKETSEYVYLAYNKPKGVVSHNPQKGELGVEQLVQIPGKKLAPLGRLDKASHGLMLLSDDGRIVDKLLSPQYAHEKEYEVEVDKPIRGADLAKMENGVQIENYKTKPCKAVKTSRTTFSIILTEGKKHQIRRMCASLGYQVSDLKRTRIMNITLGNLKKGSFQHLEKDELKTLLDSLG